ncbi:hypothetical protein HNQ60_001210 [Povalibacter uvarum]|uniref:Uncharacterized protein n=1 Tax=Povalibacter uvarum TaxID=732238 RepID=A0A841HIF9_9GAMM|nr:hypothetical protein [Povalibacter uvarum]
MESVGDVVDLDPAVVRAIQEREGYVALIFSQQPAYSRAVGNNPRLVPLYDCEIHVEGARIELLQVELPYETTEWEIEYNGGSRSYFLPTQFAAAGPVRLKLGPSDEPRIVVSGSSVRLHLGEQVGTFEQRAAT